MNMRLVLGYIAAYIFWIVSMLLTVLFLIMGRTTFPFILGSMMAESTFDARQWALAFDRIFTIVVGMGLVANMVVVESYFRNGVKTGDLMRRIARVFGIQLLLLFVADASQQFMLLRIAFFSNRLILLFLELAAGLFFTIYSFKMRPKKKTRGVENMPVN
jgi:hypothetical protein